MDLRFQIEPFTQTDESGNKSFAFCLQEYDTKQAWHAFHANLRLDRIV